MGNAVGIFLYTYEALLTSELCFWRPFAPSSPRPIPMLLVSVMVRITLLGPNEPKMVSLASLRHPTVRARALGTRNAPWLACKEVLNRKGVFCMYAFVRLRAY